MQGEPQQNLHGSLARGKALQAERWVFILKMNVLEAKPKSTSDALTPKPLWLVSGEVQKDVTYLRLTFCQK